MKTKQIFLPLLILFLLLAGCKSQTAAPTAVPTATLSPAATTMPEATKTRQEPDATETPAPPAATATPISIDFDNLVPEAQSFLDELDQGDFAAGFARFDDTMKDALPEDKLEDLWAQLLAQVGAYQEMTGVRTEAKDGYYAVIVTSQFANALLDVRVVFDSQGKIAGLFFTPAQEAEPQSFTPPDYATPEAFAEKDVVVGSGDWALPGTLTMPKGDGPFPAVVLVHGSGPNDRDETIGPNKPFRDLAWGLASRGIAVLRYDKRTRTHAAKYTGETLADLTLQGETIDDALLAAQLLRETEGIDPGRIYVAGHSLGALAAPLIGEQDPSLAGLILMAGPSRPLEDVVLDQVQYLFELQGSPESSQAEMDTLATQVVQVKDLGLSETTPPEDFLLDLSPAYWSYLNAYDPVATAQALSMPMLILQGERDYQVLAEKDFVGWQTALQDRLETWFKLYPDLNHLFMTGTGKSTPQEYDQPGHVSQEVIDDIVSYVNP